MHPAAFKEVDHAPAAQLIVRGHIIADGRCVGKRDAAVFRLIGAEMIVTAENTAHIPSLQTGGKQTGIQLRAAYEISLYLQSNHHHIVSNSGARVEAKLRKRRSNLPQCWK